MLVKLCRLVSDCFWMAVFVVKLFGLILAAIIGATMTIGVLLTIWDAGWMMLAQRFEGRRKAAAVAALAPYIATKSSRAEVVEKAFISDSSDYGRLIIDDVSRLRGVLEHLYSMGYARDVIGNMIQRAPTLLRMRARPSAFDSLRFNPPAAITVTLSRLKRKMPDPVPSSGAIRRTKDDYLERAVAKDARLLVQYTHDCQGMCRRQCGSCIRNARIPIDDW